MDLEEMNRKVIAEFRENNGEVGDTFDGMPICLINVLGAKTGISYTKPLAYLLDGDRYIIIASFAGALHHPPWYRNILTNPEFELEAGDEKFRVRAESLSEPERTEMYDKMVAKIPIFGEYRGKKSRTIPVLALTRV